MLVRGKVFADMAIRTRAKATNVLMSPRKVRLVLDLIRGKHHDDAVALLRGVPNRAARVVEKLVRSAAANAENNLGISRDSIKIVGAFADGGPMMKRIQPRAQGRAYRILKRSSHVTVIVEEAEPKVRKRIARVVTKSDAKRKGRGKAESQTAAATAAAPETVAETPKPEAQAPVEEAAVAEAEVAEAAEPVEAEAAPEDEQEAPAEEQVAEAPADETAPAEEPSEEDKA